MSLTQREDFKGRIANIVNLANEKTTGPKEMISVLSGDNIKQYLVGKQSKKVEIQDKDKSNRPDFSDLLDL